MHSKELLQNVTDSFFVKPARPVRPILYPSQGAYRLTLTAYLLTQPRIHGRDTGGQQAGAAMRS
jgi:hypothetical protein